MSLATRNGDNDIEFFSGAFITSDFAREKKNSIIESIKKDSLCFKTKEN